MIVLLTTGHLRRWLRRRGYRIVNEEAHISYGRFDALRRERTDLWRRVCGAEDHVRDLEQEIRELTADRDAWKALAVRWRMEANDE